MAENRHEAKGGGVQHFWTTGRQNPLPVIDRAAGVYVWDKAGNRYLDATSGPVACNLGHGNPAVLEALRRQADRVTFAYPSMFANDANDALGDRLTGACGPGFDRALFVSGGSEAMEMAFKFARQHALALGQAERSIIVSRTPSYHGSTLGALAATGDPISETVFGPMMMDWPRVPTPRGYRPPPPFADAGEYAEHCTRELEATLIRCGSAKVLAFVMEPICGLSLGAESAPDFYYRRVREICSRHGVLLIFDEVMTAMGRCGRFLAAHYWPDAQPDIVVLAKGLGSGYFPLGSIISSEAMVRTVREAGGFTIGHTYKTNPLACAVADAVLQETERLGLVERSERLGIVLRTELAAMAAECRVIGDVRGRGLLNAIELVRDQATAEPFPIQVDPLSRITQLGREEGILFYARRTAGGGNGDWLMVTPPLTISAAELAELLEKLRRVLQRLHSELC